MANLRDGQYDRDHKANNVRNDIYVIASNWFVNRCPMVTRTPRLPVGSTTFSIVQRGFRSRTSRLAATLPCLSNQITLADSSAFMNGDVLELESGERVELTEDPHDSSHSVAVRRGVEGTCIAQCDDHSTVKLISNSRTGAHVDKDGVKQKATAVSQYCQTWQHPVPMIVSEGNIPRSLENEKTARTPFEYNKMIALQNLMDDMEMSSYYGRGEDPAVAGRPKQKGLRTLLTTNNTINPLYADSYTAADFIRDTLEKCRINGGDPDVLLVSSNFMKGFATWGQALQRIDAGVNVFGTPINVWEAPFLGGVSIIEAPLLNPYTAVVLTSSEVRMRMKRHEFWNPRGTRGDAYEGDWIAEGAIEVENESYHAWLEGITKFSAHENRS